MTERAYPFVHQILEARALRVFLFCLSLVTLAYVDLRIGGVMLDPNSVYPFFILLLAPMSLSFKLGRYAINAVRRSCIAIGVFVCVINLAFILTNLNSIDLLAYKMRLIYSPLALAIIMSFLLSLIEENEEREYTLSITELMGLCIIFSMALAAVLFFFYSREYFTVDIFIETDAALITIIISSVCLAHPRFRNLYLIERLNKASLAVLLTFVVIGVSIYTYVSSSTDVEASGGLVAFSIMGMLYGSAIAIFTISAGGQSRQSKQDEMLFDWHLVEAYVFYALITFPPESLVEILTQLFAEGILTQ